MKRLLIEKELQDASSFSFTKQDTLPEISHRNVVLAEAMIANDSDYILSGDVCAKPDGKYKGSTAYWMHTLKDALDHNSNDTKIKKIITEAVLAVDRENSTHLAADSLGPSVITERIYLKRHALVDILKDRSKGFRFIEDLSAKTGDSNILKGGKTYHPRENYSFATKFCHYACLFFFDNDKERVFRDNYSIYDRVVAKALPDYLKAYNILKADKRPYKEADFKHASSYALFSELIDCLRDDKVSRNGFDHLLWYYHKAR